MNKLLIVSIASIIVLQNLFAFTEDESKMINAVKNGDSKTIRYLLSQNVNPNIKDERGYSLIHIAAENNKTESIKALKNSPYTDLNILLETNAKIESEDYEYIDGSYCSAMDVATVNDNFESVKLLIDYGANINFQMKEKPRSEFLASKYADTEILELYLNKNVYILMNSEDVIALITSAALGNNVKNINYLITSLGIGVDTKDTNTVLHYAAGSGSVEAMKELIRLGANVNNTNADFKTPLHYVLDINSKRMVESVELLLKSKANPNIKDINGNTALHLAVINSHKSKSYLTIIDTLIKNYADVNIINEKNQYPLNIAAQKNDYQVSSILIDGKANLNNIDEYYAPIHFAVLNNNINLIKKLIENKADINIKDKNKNYTPLSLAIEKSNFEICKLLLENNALADETSIKLSEKIGDENIIKLIKEYN